MSRLTGWVSGRVDGLGFDVLVGECHNWLTGWDPRWVGGRSFAV